MTQLVPATCVLGPGKTGLTIGLRVLNLDGTEYSAFSTTGVAETSTAGTYRKAGGVVAPLAGGYIVWGTALVDYAEATVESAAANVTMVKGAAINDLVSGSVVAQLAAAQGAVEFGQVKIVADAPFEGALSISNRNNNGMGTETKGGLYGLYTEADTALGLGFVIYDQVNETFIVSKQGIRDASKLAPSAGAPAAGSVDAHLDDILEDTAAIDSNVDLLLAADTSTSDATTAGAISRRRGNSWAIPLTIGAITGYTSLWFTIKSSYDDADTSALVQVKLNSPSALDGLLYVNGTTASSAALGSITVSDATTGAIVVNVDETITDDLAPGTYYYDVQTLIAGAVATPDSGVFTVTADVTRSVA